MCCYVCFFFFKQKTAYEMRISDWSSDVCSSDLQPVGVVGAVTPWNYPVSMLTRKIAPALAAGCTIVLKPAEATPMCAIEMFKILHEIGRASCRERVCQYV